ncbi:MAG TPA: DUF11 domain-containing protein [Thermoanaerobaculaceae bacterium]|nr:DUF11 domain-containing protein [Thermoanaerobaculaceae bacterium]
MTPLSKLRITPDITTVLSGATVGPADVGEDNLAGTVSLINIGTIPDGAHLDGYAVAANGDQLLSFDTALTLGGTTFQRNDVIRYNGSTYTLEFSGGANGVPDGVDIKDLAPHGGNLLLAFDSAFAAGGTTYFPGDVAEWNGSTLTKFFDGAAAGVPDGMAINGLHLLPSGHLLLSFDTTGTIAGLTFDRADIAEYTPGSPGTWEVAYAGAAAQPTGWSAADLTALDATPGSNTFDVALSLSGPTSLATITLFGYTITVTNLGPQAATALSVSDPLPAGVLFQAVSAPAGWSCLAPAVGSNGTVTCTSPSLAPGSPQTFVLSVTSPVSPGPISDTATVATSPADTNPGNDSATVSSTVTAGIETTYDVAIAKAATPAVAPGATITYTLVATNNGPGAASALTVSDPLPAGVLFSSLAAPGGWSCSTPAVGANGTVSCTIASLAPASPQTFVIQATAPLAATVVTNTATVSANPADQNPGDNASTAQTAVGQVQPIPALGGASLGVLAALLAGAGLLLLRRG